MKYYLAPLEGITGYIFRNAQNAMFSPADKYFSPFLVPKPNSKKQFTSKELADILPEHNKDIYLVPQIMTNKAVDFIEMANNLADFGYREINLNLGCPSRTVVSKGRGAGFLTEPEALKKFFDEIFSKLNLKISVKTRLGKDSPEEFFALLNVFEAFPFEELIIHPRVQTDYYNGNPNLTFFSYACEKSQLPLCYNGDIFTRNDFEQFSSSYESVTSVMLGRGMIANPNLIGKIKTGETLDKEIFHKFHDRLLFDYKETYRDDKNAVFRMKEFWYYAASMFSDSSKYAKKIKKASSLAVYEDAVARLFDEQELIPEAGFQKITKVNR